MKAGGYPKRVNRITDRQVLRGQFDKLWAHINVAEKIGPWCWHTSLQPSASPTFPTLS